jgi:hypothetical protein
MQFWKESRVKISIEMEPRELHEILMLAAATMAPDEPEPTSQPVRVQAKRITNKSGGGNGYTDNLPAPTKDIRAWAKDAGFHPPKGGMLPQDIIEAYRQSHRKVQSA